MLPSWPCSTSRQPQTEPLPRNCALRGVTLTLHAAHHTFAMRVGSATSRRRWARFHNIYGKAGSDAAGQVNNGKVHSCSGSVCSSAC
jgi:hypothetical protein